MSSEYDEVIAGLRRAYDAKVDERDVHAVESWKDAERSRFLSLLHTEEAATLLDVGAATGVHADYFRDAGLEVTCVDLSPEMTRRCRDKGLAAYTQDVLHLDLPHRFAAAFAMNSLLHVRQTDLPSALERIRDVLEPGGLFYLGQYGGIAFEGAWADDSYEPKRYFSRLTDEHLCDVGAAVFTIVDFRRIDIGAEPAFGGFQALTLRNPVQLAQDS